MTTRTADDQRHSAYESGRGAVPMTTITDSPQSAQSSGYEVRAVYTSCSKRLAEGVATLAEAKRIAIRRWRQCVRIEIHHDGRPVVEATDRIGRGALWLRIQADLP